MDETSNRTQPPIHVSTIPAMLLASHISRIDVLETNVDDKNRPDY